MAFGKEYYSNSEEILYAVHTTVMGHGLHFMGGRGKHKATNLPTIRSRKDAKMIDLVTKLIRKTAGE